MEQLLNIGKSLGAKFAVSLLYRSLLHRSPDEAGLAGGLYTINQLGFQRGIRQSRTELSEATNINGSIATYLIFQKYYPKIPKD
nr:hypothetical protein [Novosphingobium panipatense]